MLFFCTRLHSAVQLELRRTLVLQALAHLIRRGNVITKNHFQQLFA